MKFTEWVKYYMKTLDHIELRTCNELLSYTHVIYNAHFIDLFPYVHQEAPMIDAY